MNTILDALNWRYAVKRFDAEKKLSSQQVEDVLQAAVLTPSSYGLQPYKIVVVENKDLRDRLQAASHGQPQVTDASHFLVLCGRKDFNHEYLQDYIERIALQRNTTADTMSGFLKMMEGHLFGKFTEQDRKEWIAKQVYIVLGNIMTACAAMEIDTCPMEGLDSAEYDKILDLDEQNLFTALACPIGYRSTEDKYAGLPKFRYPQAELVVKQ